MTPARMAAIHAAAFGDRGQVWPEAAIEAMLARAPIRWVAAGADGFAILQVLPPEAELLTIAVDPAAQGRGVGTALLRAAMSRARLCGARTMWLDVAEDNAPARALYARAGFAETGRRPGYYARTRGKAVDALLLSRGLAAEKTGTLAKR